MKAHRILEHLDDCQVCFQWLAKHIYGKYIPSSSEDDDEILINLELHVVDTAVHEVLHRENPRWSEKKVLNETLRVVQSMTLKEIRAILWR